MKAFYLLAVAFLGCLITSAAAQTLVGPGPDPACGGTELRITREHGQVRLIQQTVFASNRTIVERYRPLPGSGDWQVTLSLYSARWQRDELPTKARLVRRVSFRASRAAVAAPRYQQSFGYGAIQWAGEPHRLLDFYEANHTDFHPET